LLSQSKEGQHGNDDNYQTDDVNDLVHGDLRFVCAVTIMSIAQSSRSSLNGKDIDRQFIAVFYLISRNQIGFRRLRNIDGGPLFRMSRNEDQWRGFVCRAVKRRWTMRKIAIALLAGAGALSVGSAAKATDIYSTTEYGAPGPVQQVRMVCDEDGRCYRTHGGSRVIIRDSYGYAPRERYIERRTYRDWDDGPRAGVGFRAPGVSVGVGVDNDRW